MGNLRFLRGQHMAGPGYLGGFPAPVLLRTSRRAVLVKKAGLGQCWLRKH